MAAKMNPQIPFGEDILSRITYVIMNGSKALNEIQKAVTKGINSILKECCNKANINVQEIYEVNLVGNTAMHHLFLGLWPKYLTYSPFVPVIRRGIDIKASKLGLKIHSNANSHFLPIIGGFVGSDHTAVLLASKMMESKKIMMAIDVGTNTEISLGNRDQIRVCSCASGPAFEGMATKFGMRASTGAIEQITIDNKTLTVSYRTIENNIPIGICGSGFIDGLAELLKCGLISQKGNFIPELAKKTDRLRKSSMGWEFVIAWKKETILETDIVISQRDIRELQKAKAAIHTGAEILMKRMNITEDKICNLVVAGAFGNFINPENACIIGMYPEISLEKIQFMGNLAGTGARMTLISKELREFTEEISNKVKYYELAVDRGFQKEYIQSLDFPHANLKKYPRTTELLMGSNTVK
jgi:uncharacterized 2Fe-2S/4Fe-4S cluster protein (DUF4445 family)